MAKAKKATEKQLQHHQRVRELGCIVEGCTNPAAAHHIETNAGGRRNHDRVIPLCHYHHQGDQGIHTLKHSPWQEIYGTEQDLLRKTLRLLIHDF